MRQACQVPSAVGAALMPDAHVGYGLPIGGVLACENAVIPYAVGVDIACRMKLSVLDLPVESLESQFGTATKKRSTAARGSASASSTSRAQSHAGDGPRLERHPHHARAEGHGLEAARHERLGQPFRRVRRADAAAATTSNSASRPASTSRCLSHSGSRGAGAAVCSTYSQTAQRLLPKRYKDLGRLAWLDLDSEAGQEYWAAMNLMGDYAAANHAVIHRLVAKLLGAEIIAGVENHHNFAWKERHQGREVIVHRKGATPAGAGVLGVIPGSMADPAFVVRGRAIRRASTRPSHGAGRRMSRKKANDMFRFQAVRKELEAARRPRAGGRLGRSAGRLQGHPRSDGRPAGPGRNRRPVRPEDRPHVRRRQPGGGLTVSRGLVHPDL